MTIYIPLRNYLNGGADAPITQAIKAIQNIDFDMDDTTVRFFFCGSYDNEAIAPLVSWCNVFKDLDVNTVVFEATERFINNYKGVR